MIKGGAGKDTFSGAGGNDTLSSSAGNDRLYGEAGNDWLDGRCGQRPARRRQRQRPPHRRRGHGYAHRRHRAGTCSSSTTRRRALQDQGGYITDFKGKEGDRIDLKLVDADTRKRGDQRFSFIGKEGFTKAGQVRYEKTKKETFVYLNTDNDKAAEAVIKLKGAIDLRKAGSCSEPTARQGSTEHKPGIARRASQREARCVTADLNRGLPMRTFEDFPPGLTQTFGPLTVSKDDIVAFAREYDAAALPRGRDRRQGQLHRHADRLGLAYLQPQHAPARRRAASRFLRHGGAGHRGGEVGKARAGRGDTLRSRMTVLESRISKSRPSLGLVRFHFDMVNQADETVLTQTNWVMFATREAEPVRGGGRQVLARRCESLPGDRAGREIPPVSANPYFEDLVIGETEELGSYTFTAGRHRRLRQAVRSAALPCGCGGRQRAACSARSAPRAGIRRASG